MGMFFTKDDKPYFSPDQKLETEIKTEASQGYRIVVETKPEQLLPNKYYLFGEVKSAINIQRLLSYSKEYLEVYAGEFTLKRGGSVKFPSIIRWATEPDFKVGYTYQFEIKNGIGQFIKVR